MLNSNNTLMRLVRDVNTIKSALRRVGSNLPLYDIANENTPATLSADQNNYVPGNYDVLRLNATTDITITGFAGGQKGRFIKLFNIGLFPITLAHQNTSSIPENRFQFSNSTDIGIPPGSNTILYYDYSELRWIGGDSLTAGALYANAYDTTNVSIPNNAFTKLDITNATLEDQYGIIDKPNSRIIVPFDASYFILSTVNWENKLASTVRIIELRQKGGTEVWSSNRVLSINSSLSDWQSVSLVTPLPAGRDIDVYVYQSTGGNLNIGAKRLSIFKVS